MAGALELEKLLVRISADGAQYEKVFGQLERRAADFGKSLTRIGLAASAAITAPITAAAAAATREFASFDQAMTETFAKMGRQTPAIRKEMEDVAKALSISGDVAFDPTQLAGGYEELASAGLDAARSMAALPATAKFAQAGAFGLDVAVKSLTGSMASFFGGIPQDAKTFEKEMIRFSDVIVGVANETTTGVKEVANAMAADAAVAAKEYGMSIEELGAILGVYAMQNKEAEEAGNLTGRALRLMTASFVGNRKAWEELGINIVDNATGKWIGFADAIGQLEQAFVGIEGPARVARLEALGFETLSQKAILPLIGQSAELRRQAELYKQTGVTQEMAAIQMESFTNQAKLAWNAVKVLGIEIGGTLAPHVMKATEAVKAGVAWWRGLSQEQQEATLKAAAFAAAIGPVALVMGRTLSMVGLASSGLKVIGGVGARALGLIRIAGLAALVPFAKFAAIAAVVGYAIKGIAEKIMGPMGLAIAWNRAKVAAHDFFNGAAGFLANFHHNMQALLDWLPKNWLNILKDIGSAFATVLANTPHNLMVGLETMTRLLTAFGGWVAGLFQRMFTKDFLTAVVGGLKQGLGLLGKFFGALHQMMLDFAQGKFDRPLGDFMQQLWADFGKGAENLNLAETFGDILAEQAGKLRNPLSGFKSSITQGPNFLFNKPAEKVAEDVSKVASALDGVTSAATKAADAMKSLPPSETLAKIKELEDDLRKQVATFGMSSAAIKEWELRQAGATDESLKTVKAINKQLEALEKRNELLEEGKRVTEQFRTPLEAFEATQTSLLQMLRVGSINAETFRRAIKSAQEELRQARQAARPDHPSGLAHGTASAMDFVAAQARFFTAQRAENALQRMQRLRQQAAGRTVSPRFEAFAPEPTFRSRTAQNPHENRVEQLLEMIETNTRQPRRPQQGLQPANLGGPAP